MGPFIQARAEVNRLKGDYVLAKQQYDQAVHLLSRNTSHEHRLGGALAGAVLVRYDLAECGDGKAKADEALTLYVDPDNALRPSHTMYQNTSAYGSYCLGDLQDATEKYRTSLAVNASYGQYRALSNANAWNGLGLIALEQKKLLMADTLFTKARVLSEDLFTVDNPHTARIMINQALLRLAQKRYDEARGLLLAAMEPTRRGLGSQHDQIADIHLALGDADRGIGEPADAKVHYEKALTIYQLRFPDDHPKIIETRERLSRYIQE